MGQKIVQTLFTVIFLLTFPQFTFANEKISENSAELRSYNGSNINNHYSYLIKNLVVAEFFEKYSSPLAKKSSAFISSCIKYQIDCYLLPSIAAIESYYGKRYIKEYNNPFGWGGGYYRFKNLEEAIDVVSKRLKNRYIARGATNLKLIGKYYSTDPNWWVKTTRIKRRLEELEKKYNLLLDRIIVQ